MYFQFNNGIEFINRNSWEEIKFASTWNAQKLLVPLSAHENYAFRACRCRSWTSADELTLQVHTKAKQSLHRHETWRNFKINFSFHSLLFSFLFFRLKYNPFRLASTVYFILFMKTSGTAEQADGKILKTHIWNINLNGFWNANIDGTWMQTLEQRNWVKEGKFTRATRKFPNCLSLTKSREITSIH